MDAYFYRRTHRRWTTMQTILCRSAWMGWRLRWCRATAPIRYSNFRRWSHLGFADTSLLASATWLSACPIPRCPRDRSCTRAPIWRPPSPWSTCWPSGRRCDSRSSRHPCPPRPSARPGAIRDSARPARAIGFVVSTTRMIVRWSVRSSSASRTRRPDSSTASRLAATPRSRCPHRRNRGAAPRRSPERSPTADWHSAAPLRAPGPARVGSTRSCVHAAPGSAPSARTADPGARTPPRWRGSRHPPSPRSPSSACRSRTSDPRTATRRARRDKPRDPPLPPRARETSPPSDDPVRVLPAGTADPGAGSEVDPPRACPWPWEFLFDLAGDSSSSTCRASSRLRARRIPRSGGHYPSPSDGLLSEDVDYLDTLRNATDDI